MDVGQPPMATPHDMGKLVISPSDCVGLGLIGVLFFGFIIAFILDARRQHRYRSQHPPPPPPRPARNSVTTANNVENHNFIGNLATFVYSEAMMTKTGDDSTNANNSSDCSICLMDYRQSEILLMLPECGHAFHATCIDMWLKVHPTCPMCRKLSVPINNPSAIGHMET